MWIIIANAGMFLFISCFDVAHWLFAFEYFTIAKVMPLAKQGLTIPEEKLRKYNAIKTSIVASNVLAAGLTAFFIFMASYHYLILGKSHDLYQLLGIVFTLLLTMLQLLSAILLLYAVFLIHRHLKKGLKATQINAKNMILHATTFILLGIGLIVENVFYIIANFQQTTSSYANYIEVVAIGGTINFLG